MRRSGFSLVELSIVLVILGLLTGGILAGQSLIRASELRAVTTEYMRYTTAFQAFRDKYFAVPGDFNNATAFWGSAGGTGSDTTCQNAAHTGTLTCNGNGDGAVFDNTGSNGIQEQYHTWQHLANAGLIEGSYTAANGQFIGVTVPASKLSGAYWHARNGQGYATPGGTTVYAGDANDYGVDYGKNMFRFRNTTWSTTVAGTAPLKPEEAWNIDKKLDDGMPGTGRIIAQKGDGVSVFCTTGAGLVNPADIGTVYSLNNSSKDCVIDFANAF